MAVFIAPTFSVDAADSDENVVAVHACKSIRVRENGTATVQYYVRGPSGTDYVLMYPGESYTFYNEDSGRGISPGDIVGKMKTASGSATFSQEEFY